MTIRFFRPLTALGLAAAIAAAGIGTAVTPDLHVNGALTDTALQFNSAPVSPDLPFADIRDAGPATPDLQVALQFNDLPAAADLQVAEGPDATPDLQFC